MSSDTPLVCVLGSCPVRVPEVLTCALLTLPSCLSRLRSIAIVLFLSVLLFLSFPSIEFLH